MAKVVEIVSVVCFSCTTFFFLLAFGSPWWYVTEAAGVAAAIGLWELCTKGIITVGWTCDSYGDAISLFGDAFKAAQAMMCLGLITAMVDLVLYVLVFVKGLNVKIAGAVCGGVGLFALIGVAIFADNAPTFQGYVTGKYGWSFAMACLSLIFGIVNPVLTFLLDRFCQRD